MRTWKSILMAVALVALASPAMAGGSIGVYFDEAGTQMVGVFEGGMSQYHTAYVVAVGTEMWMGGAAFRVTLDPRIFIMSADYPDAIKLGEPADGVSVGFTDCRSGHEGNNVLVCVLQLWTGNELMTNAQIHVVDHPTEGGILVSDCSGHLSTATGVTTFLTVTVGDEPTSWGQVKGLYR
jgi:type IV secretory pathway VirB2 component (pilin)